MFDDGVGTGVLDRPGRAVDGPVGRWGPFVSVVAAATRTVEDVVACSEVEIATGLGVLDEAQARVQRSLVLVAVEAYRRGLHVCSGLSLHDWVAARCTWLPRPVVAEVVVLAREWDRVGHGPVREAVAGGRLPVSRAARLVRALLRVRPVSDVVRYEEYAQILMPVAMNGSEADLRKALDHLVAVALSDREAKARERSVRELRGVHESSLADGSLTRFVLTCDGEGAALVRAVLASPLARPVPDETGPDPRSATQRRYDAVMAVLGRGMSAPQGVPRSGKAKIFVTMSYDALKDALVGAGHTMTGEALSAGQVRRLACTAELVPVVLGSGSQVLDLGREVRLATPGQHQLLWLRDQGCSFPGCTVPATWCEAHHVSWWSRGGATDITNLALLCGRHHTLVHDHDLLATITSTCVTWHL